jgi:hypothetical protein
MPLLSGDAWISEVPGPFTVLLTLQIVTDSDMTLHNITANTKHQKKPYLEHHSCQDLYRLMQALFAVNLSNSRGAK